jgi:hypothetical protein
MGLVEVLVRVSVVRTGVFSMYTVVIGIGFCNTCGIF